jgi:enterochelin esterase-like enzyme
MFAMTHKSAQLLRRLFKPSRKSNGETLLETKSDADPYLLPWSGRPQDVSGTTRPAYVTAQGRDLRIDLLRGFFVLAMIVDHVRGVSPLYLLTGGNRFFVSAAEGFILLSGLMAGLIYRRVVARDGLGAAVRKVWARALTLYLLTVGITLVLLPLSELVGLPWAQGVDFTHSLNLVVGVLTLHRTYYLADVLLLYTLLFAVMPAALFLMTDGKTWLLVGLSWSVWGLHQLFPNEVAATWPIAGNYLFAFAAWQLLFFNGLALGYQRDRIPALTRQGARRLQIGTGFAFLGLIALFALLEMPATSLPSQLTGFAASFTQAQLWFQEFVFGKADLRIGRVAAAAVVMPFIFLTLTRQWRTLNRPLTWLLAPLGQNSLYAFTAHVVVVAGVAMALTPIGLAASSPWWLNAMLQVASILLIWMLVRRHVLEPTSRTRSIWRASPAAVAILAVVILPWLPAPRTLASTTVVSDEVLARARAYGTPVVSLDGSASVSEAVLARARAYGTPIVSLTRLGAVPVRVVPSPPSAVDLPAATPGVAAAAAQQAAFPGAAVPLRSVATPAPPQPVGTPQPATTPLPTTSSTHVESRVGTPELAIIHDAATPQPANDAVPAASLLQRIAANPVPAAPAVQKSAAPAVASQLPPQPVVNIIAPKPAPQPVPKPAPAEPLPPLPPDSEHLRTDYIGPLTGSIYGRSFHSDLLNKDMPYWIYLPPGYGQTTRRYPVLYMLHGGGGVLDEWAALGLFEAADRQIEAGTLQPMIIVLPQGDKSYWTNGINNTPRYGDYTAYEVVGHIDAAFGTIRDRSARAIGGLSMGAWGALYQAFTHPDIFGVVGAHSPSLYPDNNNLKFLGTGAEFASKDPVSLARTAAKLGTLHIWIDIGANDPWLEETTGLHNTLAQRDIVHEWHVNSGYHASEYWAQHAPEYLQFYGHALAGQA